MSPTKTLIVHDRFQYRGGGERLILELARTLEADIVTEFWTDETFDRSEAPHTVTMLDQGEPSAMVWRYFRAQWNFWKAGKLLRDYDTIIFSGNNCLAAALRPLRGKVIRYYCHTPVRYVYDLLKTRRAEEPSRLKRVLYYDVGKWLIRGLYRLGLSRMPQVITNSQNVQQRLKTYCHRDSTVVYPPILTKQFSWVQQGDYYLSYARLDGLKRVADIVRAFQQMPDKRLVVASGGEEEAAIRALAQGYDNISVLGWVEHTQLEALVGSCLATIYIPVDEDFGMTPVESMAAGKPCIGVNEGGLRETIIPEETGLLIPSDYTVDDLIGAVRALTPERAEAMRAACEAQAQRFSLEVFEQRMRQVVAPQVAIDASRSIDGVQKTGVEVVSDALLKHLLAESTESVLCYTPKPIAWIPEVAQRVIARKRFWTLIGLSLALWRDRPDVLFVPVHTLPFFCPSRTVRVIHDVSFLRAPQAYSRKERWYMRWDLWRAKRLCTSVIVPTEAVKQDLITRLQWDASKIMVTGWALEPSEVLPRQVQTATPFILFVSRVEEKKNIANLIRGFQLFRATHPTWELRLAGKPGYGYEQFASLLELPGVKALGYISEEEKAQLLSQASLLAHVSFEEGFSFPMLEAFRAGVPVVASTIAPLREIAQDAAVFANPSKPEEIAASLAEVADNVELQAQLVARGSERLKAFSWERITQTVHNLLVPGRE